MEEKIQNKYPLLSIKYELHYFGDESNLYFLEKADFSSTHLNRLATLIIALCDGSHTVMDIYDLIKEDVTPDENGFVKYIHFIQKLNKANIIKLEDKPHAFLSSRFRNIKISGEKDAYYPYFITIDLTNKCNLNCTHCYKEASKVRDDFFPLIDFKNLIGLIRGKVKQLQITGGEPLLHPDLEEMLDVCKNDFRLSILTNGTLIKKTNISFLKRYNFQISMYGYNSETYKKFSGVEEGFMNFTNALEVLKTNGNDPTISIVLNKYNYLYFEKYLTLLEHLGISKLRIGLPSTIGRSIKSEKNSKVWKTSLQERQEILRRSQEILQDFPHMKMILWDDMCKYIFEERNEIKPLTELKCSAGKSVISIDEKGIVRPCVFLPGEYFNTVHFSQYFSELEWRYHDSYQHSIKSYINYLNKKGISIENIPCFIAE